MTKHVLKRFRKEVREREDIQPNATVTLSDDQKRRANTKAAELLLRDVFGEHIEITIAPGGLRCGSREEAAIGRLKHYTRAEVNDQDLLLSSVLLQDLEEYLASKNEAHDGLYLPESPEQRLVQRLGEAFPAVLYGL